MSEIEKKIAEKKIAEMIAILKKHNIEMRVTGCTCFDSPHVCFSHKEKLILDCEPLCNFSTASREYWDNKSEEAYTIEKEEEYQEMLKSKEQSHERD